jgi:hypothetical protein
LNIEGEIMKALLLVSTIVAVALSQDRMYINADSSMYITSRLNNEGKTVYDTTRNATGIGDQYKTLQHWKAGSLYANGYTQYVIDIKTIDLLTGEVQPQYYVSTVPAIGTNVVLKLAQGASELATEYVNAAELPATALKAGGIKADSLDGIPVAVACDHVVMGYTTKDSSYTGKTAEGKDTVFTTQVRIDSTVLAQQITRVEFKVPHEFQPGHNLVYRVFDVDPDGNEALVDIHKYLLSHRSDGQIYKVSDYPVINPDAPAKE